MSEQKMVMVMAGEAAAGEVAADGAEGEAGAVREHLEERDGRPVARRLIGSLSALREALAREGLTVGEVAGGWRAPIMGGARGAVRVGRVILSSAGPSEARIPIVLDWTDHEAVKAWLGAVGEQVADLRAAAEDATRPPAERALGRSQARALAEEAARSLEALLHFATGGDGGAADEGGGR